MISRLRGSAIAQQEHELACGWSRGAQQAEESQREGLLRPLGPKLS